MTKKSSYKEHGMGRFNTFKLAAEWLYVLQKTDAGHGITQNEIVKKAYDDIFLGRVTKEDVEKATSNIKETPARTHESSKTSSRNMRNI
jgi:hypothetical protein